jgi:phenylacetate-CoA ligase
MARAFFAAGIRPDDRVLNCFSYHHMPAGAMMEAAATAIGCPVYPGGTGQAESQVAAIRHYGLTAYVGTPDFLQVILDAAAGQDLSVDSISKAAVGGGALFPAMREKYADQGVTVYQSYGTADLGLIAYESPALDGMLIDEHVIVEIVRPGTGDPVPAGEVGEVVVTTLNPDYPLIRFATGDLSALMTGVSPCGRTAPRIRGWMGRADQTTKVRGMFVHPEQVAELLAEFPDIRRARLVISHAEGQDSMVLKYEAGAPLDQSVVEAAIRNCIKLRGTVEHCHPGSLANDGIVIEDARTYE